MKIRIKSMLGRNHSWSQTVRSLALQFSKNNHDLSLESIDGYRYLDKSLNKFINSPMQNPDLDFTYTLPKNFKTRFLSSSKIKASIFNYESSLLPVAWRSLDEKVDYIFASSNYCKEVFINSGWNQDKIHVVPLGLEQNLLDSKDKLEEFDDGKFNFLNVSIPHYRKNLDILIESYYRAFCGNDNVRLILKTSLGKPKNIFECYVPKIIDTIQRKLRFYKYPAISIVTKRYENMASLYNSSDCLISTTASEGFGLPMLEAMYCGVLVAAPYATGQKDFLSPKNSILMSAEERIVDGRYQYWTETKGGSVFFPNIDEVSATMNSIYTNKEAYLGHRIREMKKTAKQYSWSNTARKILEIVS